MAAFVFQVVSSVCVENGLQETRLKSWHGCDGPELGQGWGEVGRRKEC